MSPRRMSESSSNSSSPSRKRRVNEDSIKRCAKDEADFSDDDNFDGSTEALQERRQIHNNLERTRRLKIKQKFLALRDIVPLLDGEKSSRAMILKRATDYIKQLENKLKANDIEIDSLKRHNESLHGSIKLSATTEALSNLVTNNAVQNNNFSSVLQQPQMYKSNSVNNNLNMSLNNLSNLSSVYNFQNQSLAQVSQLPINLTMQPSTSSFVFPEVSQPKTVSDLEQIINWSKCNNNIYPNPNTTRTSFIHFPQNVITSTGIDLQSSVNSLVMQI
uniref:BHLH domain-containing protein n=1 Tax=Rhabditophanes sp. KR3021 TaxID=114890 RepID=A0AC35UHC8_9BILA